ncbi:sigma-70 family RNA polymerase sigma factor [Lentzea cavernae]|nr:sigma-70 family RNA polymerase sigma factor [Lentzea cavernae]
MTSTMRALSDSGEAEALVRDLFQDKRAAMLAYARQLTRNHAEAEDVVQEAMVRAWQHHAALLNGKGSVYGWLMTVVRNIVHDRYRARAARPQEVSVDADLTVHDHADAVVDRVLVRDVLRGLRAEHRDVLERMYFANATPSEVARDLGVPSGTVKSRSHRAIRQMRQRRAGLDRTA